MLGLSLFENSNRLLEKSQNKAKISKIRIGSTPHRVIHKINKLRVLRYDVGAPETQDIPILLVPSLINRHYILDLMPGKSLAEYLARQGFKVSLIDWGIPGDEDRYVTFDTYIETYLHRSIDAVMREAGSDQVILMGYCLGGSMAAIYAAMRPERVSGLVTLTAPINFHNSGLLSAWCKTNTFDVDLLVEAFGNLPWALMHSTFNMLRPTMTFQRQWGFLQRMWDEVFLEGFYALETWGNDAVAFPGECYRAFINSLYRDNALVNDSLYISGRKVDFGNLTCPILSVASDQDHIVPLDAAAGIHTIAHGQVTEWITGGGHIGAVVSKRASKDLWPRMTAWLKQLDQREDEIPLRPTAAHEPWLSAQISAKPNPQLNPLSH